MAVSGNDKVWLLIIRSSNEGLTEYNVLPGKNKIGREADNELVLDDNTTSSHHAEILYDQIEHTVSIRDLESTNGTFVNGRRITQLQSLYHDDQIRVGKYLLSIINSKTQDIHVNAYRLAPTKVTGQLISDSIQQYGVLLYEIGQRLVNIPNLDSALTEISELIRRMIGAEKCRIVIVLVSEFDNFTDWEVPASFVQKVIKNQTALIFSRTHQEPSREVVPITQPLQSKLLVPVVLDQKVVALIFAKKNKESQTPFFNSDLQLVLAVSNQVAMSIQRSRVEGVLIHSSKHDSLTDLPNRTLFLDRLNRSITKAKEENSVGFAVLFFDIDDFKVVNDSLGHDTGDKLLIAVAERLKHNVRNIDVVARNPVIARFGGDEFAILLDNIHDSRSAFETANRLKDILSKPFNINGKQIFSTVSIGVAVNTSGYERAEDILRDADIAMYHAKEMGKARVEIYNKTLHDRVSERMRMGTALRQGAIQKEFRLHYQPIISLRTGQTVGFEALMRWYTPDRGILNPADFLDAIDTAGLIYSTDHWVLQNACNQVVEWGNEFPTQPPPFVSVNLSAKNIKHPNLVNNINQVLHQAKLDPIRLWLEITEKVSAPDDESAIEVLRKLRSIGIRICLDDFGTGYSALNYLARFPVDVLKIDHTFVKTIGTSNDSQKIIELIIALASHLNLIVIAEGVEKAEQIPFLKSINCDYAQGFFYAMPLDALSASKFITLERRW